jgi:Fe-S-cluster-containing dehydrogenase component/DMSO reductase anchor subunit
LQHNTSSTLIDELLAEQQRLTAVERFAQHHERGERPAQAKYYRDLIPLTQPQPGQQYAFEVDLDRCSGCKACVSACHSLNGLDDGETWREVGLLLSQDWRQPFQQTVTTACHHCLDPGCLNGCPVLAYDKDPFTGIVRHLDDQCIGCQYCVMKCPYDAPKYSPKRGIVRKCDMCANRLAIGEAPACVQACPSEAIRIVVSNNSEVTVSARRGDFLPAAPSPAYTLPTTRYKSSKPLPDSLLAGDHVHLTPSESHLPLVFMLVLSQLAVGTSVAATFVEPSKLLLLIAAFAGGLAPSIALLHLGKPLKAWRAFLGWRTSWFSREAIAFGVFLPLAAGALAATLSGWKILAMFLTGAAALTGLSGVACSAMIYVDTRREFWRASQSFGKFFETTLLLGAAATLGIQVFARAQTVFLITATALVAATTAAKLVLELRIFRHLEGANAVTPTPLNKSARLLAGELGPIARLRVGCAVFGGLICPELVISRLAYGSMPGTAMIGMVLATFVLCLAGEILERYLFFTAVSPVRMPGGVVA